MLLPEVHCSRLDFLLLTNQELMGIFHRSTISVEKTSYGEMSSFEYSEWLLSWKNVRIKLCIIYHIPYSQSHPVSDAVFLEEIQEYFDSVVLCDEKLLMMGDFNLHVEDKSDFYGKEFCDVLDSYGLFNHVTVPTHEAGHTLDLIINRNIDEISLSVPRAGYFISDHCFITSTLDIPKPDLQVKTVSCRKIRQISLPDFKSDLQDICDKLLNVDDPNMLAMEYNRQLSECLDRHAPVITTTQVVRPKVAYFNDTVRDLKRSRRKAERDWRKDKDNVDLRRSFQRFRNRFVGTLDYSKTEHLSNEILSAKGDQKKLYKIIQSLTSVKKDTPLPVHDCIEQLANDFGRFFIQKNREHPSGH